MSDRFDIVILGATGYTGTYTVKYFAAFLKLAEYANVTWAIAGRSQEKLNNLVSEFKENGA